MSGPIPASAEVAVPVGRAQAGVSTDTLIWVAALVIVLLALAVRVYNVNWDENTHLHPDERFLTTVTHDIQLPSSLGEYFDTDHSRLNPYNHPSGGSFVYGTLPVFLNKAFVSILGDDDYNHVALDGRYLSAIFDTGSVFLAFLIGRRLYGGWAGLLAALLLATAPLPIQHAHFYVVDPFVAFFTALTLYFSVRIVQEGATSDYAFAGLALGCSMACKVTGALITPVIVCAALLRAWPALRDWSAGQRPSAWVVRELLQRPMMGLVLAGVLAFVAFRVAQPYAFEAPSLTHPVSLNQHWVKDQKSQSDLLGGSAFFPPTIQWIHRASYLYPLEEMLQWGMGPAFGLLGWGAFAYAAYRLVRFREPRHLLPVVFVAGFFGFMGREFTLYLRYFLPLYGVLAVLGGYALVEVVRLAGQAAQRWRQPRIEALGYGVVGLVLVLATLAGLAYLSIYTRPVTRVEASRWLYNVLPNGASIAGESWDDTVPMQLPGSPPKRFDIFSISIYDTDTPEKVSQLLQSIDRADYIVLSSNRLINSVPRNPLTYPVTTRYYQALLDGELGFTLMKEFTSYPGLLGVQFPDYMAEESFSSYDHPRVLVFQKTPAYSASKAFDLLGHGPFAVGGLTPAAADHNGLLLSTADEATQQQGGTWDDVFSDGGVVGSFPTLVWLLALELAGLALTPLALLLFRRLPDRGYLLAKPLGLLLVAYPVWLLTSLKLIHFTQATIALSLLAWLIANVWLARRHRGELTDFVRAHWRLLLVCEAVFLVAFLFSRELRLANPDLWHPFRGGEKPMDLAYLTAVVRSTTMPPYDPWFAGGYINYYYFGQFLTATLIKLTTIPPEVAYNLAIPTFFAMVMGGAFSVSYNLAAVSRGIMRCGAGFRRIPAWSPYVAGLLGAFFVGLAGNLDGVAQLSDRLTAVSPWHLGVFLPVITPLVDGVGGIYQVVLHGASLQPFDFWRSSRMMSPTISITEFPYWTFLFADLHAHLIAIPFELLTIGVCLTLVLDGSKAEGGRWRSWGVVLLLGLVVGALRWISSWDYPTFLALSLAALVISERRLEGGVAAAAGRLALRALLLVGLSFLLFKPFLDAYLNSASGVHAPPEKTVLRQYLAHFGVFVAVIGAWLFFLTMRALRVSPLAQLNRRVRVEEYAGQTEVRPGEWRWLQGAALSSLLLLGACLVLYVGGHAFVAALLPVFALVAALALREWRHRRADGGVRLFVLGMIGLALGLSMGVDIVTLNGDIQRMNTVFKFYEHIWILFALASGFGAWNLLFVVWRPALRVASLPRRLPRLTARLGMAALVVLVLAALVYPIGATPVRLNDRFTSLPDTLDGMAYMRSATYDDGHGPMVLDSDYQGIEWMRHNVSGTPTIVEGRTDIYKWGSRFSIYTGLPTVIGWDWHQKQQRGPLGFMVDERVKQVDDFYKSTDVAAAQGFLRQYGVQYVVVGQLEHEYYPAEGLQKFAAGLNGTLEPAYINGDLTIYKVTSALRSAQAGVSP